MSCAPHNRGFTLFEVIIVIAVSAIIAVASVSFIPQVIGRAQFTDAKNLIQRTLEEARSDSATGFGTLPHGVYVDAKGVTEFEGASYATGTGTRYPLPTTVSLSSASPTLPFAIIFSRIIGAPSITVGSTTVANSAVLSITGTSNATMTISSNGEITLQ